MTLANDSAFETEEFESFPPPPQQLMTEDEFEHWVFRQAEGNYEWVDGRVLMMSPADDLHDDLDGWLAALLRIYAEQKDLGIVRSDMMFRISGRRRVPDVLFLGKAKLSQLKPKRIEGPPDLAIEIVSPRSEALDWREKYIEYQSAGVKEYWVIDPRVQAIECYSLNDAGQYVQIPE
ncbi:MAG: Uma2 family endonuclease, partial [Phycisphaerae bacterium]|nr:Uma2 family endonuclease [Phycisphaerae bacterium]